MILFLLAGSPPLPGYPAAHLQPPPQPADRPSQTDALHALAEFCTAFEAAGLGYAPLNAPYLQAKRVLARAA